MAQDKDKQEKDVESRSITVKIPNISKLNPWMITTFVLLAVSLVLLVQPQITGQFFLGGNGGLTNGLAGSLTAQQAGEKAVKYINDNLVQSGQATFVSSEEFAGLMYKVITKYQNTDIDVYITKDGNWLFVSGPYDTAETTERTTTTTQPQKTCEDIKKATDAKLDAFVVSYCPYGLQMQRILAEVVKNAPALADNIKVRYIGSVVDGKVTAMHGETEATENLRQICIREEQPEKYWSYVSCFMKKADSTESCLTEAAVDKAKLSACMADGGKGVQYAQSDFDLQDQYGVTGSPTMILNGEHVSEFDFGGRTAEAVKTLLCCGFSTQPSECSTKLSTAQAATSFAETYSSSSGSSSGSC